MTTVLTLGYSPCPNDTFIFYALTQGKVPLPGIELRERLEDVETLNRLALEGSLDVTKISYHALGYLRGIYALLRSGSALGRGCGPLVVAKPGTMISSLHQGVIAIPGRLTTAHLLLRLFNPSIENVKVMTFDRIMDAVVKEEVTAGLIIHESRFTYQKYGLEKLIDLGEWWETFSGLPIPLGGILGKRSLGRETLKKVEEGIRRSILYAYGHWEEALAYCGRHSQEMDATIMKNHIELYVNEFTVDVGDEGLRSIQRLFDEAERRNIFPSASNPLLAENDR